jgi:molybdopterin molybdotransferase
LRAAPFVFHKEQFSGRSNVVLYFVASSSPSIVLSYLDAARTVREHAVAAASTLPRVESVALLESLGRVLAAPVIPDRDQPPFARSTRDGFACRAADLGKPAPLLIVGQLRAGEEWTGPELGSGQAIEIMTGAPVPSGADCVLMVEHATVAGAQMIPDSDRSLEAGANIVPAGAEARAGVVLVESGIRVGAQQIAAAAACGYENLSVCAKPRVAILATGDELVPVGDRPLAHQIRNSNSYSIAAQIVRNGATPVLCPIVRDELTEIEEMIRSMLTCDLLILSGGVSMGKYDFVEQALLNLGAEFFFTGARIQPGRPVVFGRTIENGHRYFLGLPGNPVSTLVTFALFAAPFLAALAGQGSDSLRPVFVEAQLIADVAVKPGLTRFLPAFLAGEITGATVVPLSWHGSGDQAAASRANCFLVVPEVAERLSAGTTVTVLQL